ncbi:MAG: DUF1499 domain-containing protein [Paracoccaceae bacterium]
MPDSKFFRPGLVGLILGVVSIEMVMVSAWSYRQGWWPVLQALSFSEYAVYVAGLGVLLSLLALVVRRRGRVLAVIGLLVSLPVLVMGIGWDYATRTTPPINDISTDTQDPPVFWETPTPTDYPAANAGPQRAAYPRVVPLDLPVPAAEAFDLAADLVRARGWEILSEDGVQIEAVATSFLYGFPDEVVIRVSETDTGARIDMRSRSRIGQIDRGANARRITAFLDDLASRAGAAR